MQIKTEKDTFPYRRVISGFLLVFCLYVTLAFGIPLWLHDQPIYETGLVRWINLLLVPLALSLVIGRIYRRSRIYFTHLTQKDMIQQRLVDVLRQEGYRISESLPHQVIFRSSFPWLSKLSSQPSLWIEFEDDYILLHGPWSRIQKLAKMAQEGEIFLPKSR